MGIWNVLEPCCAVYFQHGNERDDAWLCLCWQAIREWWRERVRMVRGVRERERREERGEGAREGSRRE